MAYLLGIDLGTSSVKTILVSESGTICGQGIGVYPLLTPHPGWAEQDPRDWWNAAVIAVRQSLREITNRKDILAIGLSGQMHGTVLLGKQDNLLYRAIIWPDQRSVKQVAEITHLVGLQRLIEITGSSLATGFQMASIHWLQQQESELWEQVHKVLLPKDYLRWRMIGNFATDPSDGSGTLMLDSQQREWSPLLINSLQIDPNLLPLIYPSISVGGMLAPGVAAEMGLPGGIPVIIGAADTASSLIGAGITTAQDLLLTISTGGQLVLPVTEFSVDHLGRMHTFCSALGNNPQESSWYLMSATLSAGQSLRWLRENILVLGDGDAYQQLNNLAEGSPIGANGLFFWPYLVGECSPLMDPGARGMFVGLNHRHTRADLVRAVMEGVTYSLYQAFAVMSEVGFQPRRIVMVGGGSRSQLWQKMVANVFGFPVVSLHIAEQSALGAALLAGAGIELLQVSETCKQWAQYAPPHEPNLKDHALYQESFALFQEIYRTYRARSSFGSPPVGKTS